MSAVRSPAPAPHEFPHQPAAPREPIRHFWKRTSRAVAMLMAAVATHLWVIRAPQPQPPADPTLQLAAPASAAPRRPPSVRIAVDEIVPRIAPRNPPPAELKAAEQVAAEAGAIAMATFDAHPADGPAGTSGRPATLEEITASNSPPAPDTLRLLPTSSGGSRGAPDVPTVPDLRELPPALLAFRSAPMAMPASAGALLKETSRPAAPRTDTGDGEQKQRVLDVVNRYRRAVETMDVRAAKAVWPTLDDRRLQRAFKGLNAQRVQFGDCGVSIRGRAANANCPAEATYQPRVGSKPGRVTQGEWTFALSRDEAGWQIVNLNAEIH